MRFHIRIINLRAKAKKKCFEDVIEVSVMLEKLPPKTAKLKKKE